jgi:hypothetical protein
MCAMGRLRLLIRGCGTIIIIWLGLVHIEFVVVVWGHDNDVGAEALPHMNRLGSSGRRGLIRKAEFLLVLRPLILPVAGRRKRCRGSGGRSGRGGGRGRDRDRRRGVDLLLEGVEDRGAPLVAQPRGAGAPQWGRHHGGEGVDLMDDKLGQPRDESTAQL